MASQIHVCSSYDDVTQQIMCVYRFQREESLSGVTHTLSSPLTKSTSMRSGLTCPVFFGLFLKPCRGRQRVNVKSRKEKKNKQTLLGQTYLQTLLRQLNYKMISCTRAFMNTHRAVRLTQLPDLSYIQLHSTIFCCFALVEELSALWNQLHHYKTYVFMPVELTVRLGRFMTLPASHFQCAHVSKYNNSWVLLII